MSLSAYLEEMNLQGYGHSNCLHEMLKIAGIKAASTRKADVVTALDNYLSSKENLLTIWHHLSAYDKEIIEEIIRGEGIIDRSDAERIIKKYNIKGDYSNNYYDFANFLSKNSKGNLFFIKGRIPPFILNTLKSQLKKVEIKFTSCKLEIDEDNQRIISLGEKFEKELVNIIRLISISNFKTTKANKLPTKTAVLKINNELLEEEVLINKNIEDIRKIDETTRIYGISKLLMAADIIEDNNGCLILGDASDNFLMKNIIQKCKMLLEAYIDSDICETERITEIKIKHNYSNLKSCRNLILKYISKAPIDKWVNINELKLLVKRTDRNFLEKAVGEIHSYEPYSCDYPYQRNHGWDDIEGRFIDVVLMEYLCNIGIVDVVVSKSYTDYDSEYLKTSMFKLTPLGAHVLGENKNYVYDKAEEDSGIIIQPNYEIVVQEGSLKDVHSIFLDKFAEKVSDDVVRIYKLSFKAMVTAMDNKIPIEEIIDYMKEFSVNDIPQNVMLSLEQWEKDSKKIKIRKVTLIETEDQYLMEELKSYKAIKNSIVKELTNCIEIQGKNAYTIKKNIEKKNHFCIIED